MSSSWIGCLHLTDVPAWALAGVGGAEDPFLVLEQGRVAGASPSPRAEGVRPGMTRRQAEALAGSASLHPRDAAAERARWERMLDGLNDLTPRIASIRPGLAWFGPRRGRALKRWLRGTAGRCGVGPSRLVARLAARKARAGRLYFVPAADADRFLDGVDVRALEALGFEDDLAERLRLFGFRSVRDAQSLTRRHLDAQFGEAGRRLHDLLHPDDASVSFYQPPPSIEATVDFEHDAREPGPLRTALRKAAETIEDRLDGRACQRITLRLDGRDGVRSTSRALRSPRSTAGSIARAGRALLDDVLAAGMRVVTLRLVAGSLREGGTRQADLFGRRPRLRKAVRAIQKQYPNALLKPVRDPHAVFPEDRFSCEPVDPGK